MSAPGVIAQSDGLVRHAGVQAIYPEGLTMLAKQRRALILDEVRRSGGVRVSELTQMLAVSDMTVRRDLEILAREGLLEKVHGGATISGHLSTEEPGFEAKAHRELREKDLIASWAAAMILPGSAIALSAGTTTYALAHHLPGIAGLTVVTNSIRIADLLWASGQTDPTVIVTGGVRTPSDALVGPIALNAVRSLHFDAVFMGVHGMAERTGFTTPNLTESEVNRALVSAARRLVVLADHTKWGEVGLSTFASLEEADVLVTDEAITDEARAILSDAVGELVVVPTGGSSPPSSVHTSDSHRTSAGRIARSSPGDPKESSVPAGRIARLADRIEDRSHA